MALENSRMIFLIYSSLETPDVAYVIKEVVNLETQWNLDANSNSLNGLFDSHSPKYEWDKISL